LQAPDWQVSVCVHLLPSSQPLPLVLAGFEQVPVAESHVPTSWHWSLAAHTTALLPVHTPDWHVSVWVHLSPSLHDAPSTLLGFEQVPVSASHVPAL
jgi:hypothetical protein